MRFIIDTNLTPVLAVWLVAQGHAAHHTSELGLVRATDRMIWSKAKADGAMIISKDEDFALLKMMDQAGPQVVWIRVGNTVNRVLMQRFTTVWPVISAQLTNGAPIVEVR